MHPFYMLVKWQVHDFYKELINTKTSKVTEDVEAKKIISKK